MCPGVDSASKSEYQGFLLGGEGGRCVRLTIYHRRSAERQRKSGALNYLKPLGLPRPLAGDLSLYSSIKIFRTST